VKRACTAIVALLLAGIACDSTVPSASAPPQTVEAIPIQAQRFSAHLELVGQLEAQESVRIRSEIDGVIEDVAFVEGQRIAEGDVLFTLRAAEQRASLRAANAQRELAADVYERTRALSKVNVSAAAELKRARAGVDAAEANVELAQIDLDRTQIRAPFDGVTGARLVSPGDRVDPDIDLVQIDAVDALRLRFSLPESAVGVARTGLVVAAEVAAYPDERFEGEVYFVSPSLERDTRRLPLKARVLNPDGRLRPGMFARVQLEIDREEQALLVPDSAVGHDAAGSFVWRVSAEQRAERAAVELGGRQDGLVVVRSGIRAGDVIVTSPTPYLFPGSALRVRAPGGAVISNAGTP